MKKSKTVISITITVLAVASIVLGIFTAALAYSNYQLQAEFNRLITRGEYYSPGDAQITELKNEYDAQDEYSSPEEWFEKWCNESIDKDLMSLVYKQDYESHRYMKRITAIEEDYKNGKIDIWVAIYAVRETKGEAVELADVDRLEN